MTKMYSPRRLQEMREEALSSKPDEPRTLTARLRAALAKLLRSEVQPGVITDQGGESRLGVWWRKRF